MLHHSIRGDGDRPIVLLHGFLGSGRNLMGIARGWGALDPGRSFVVPDLLGHGRSPPLPEGASLVDVARAVLTLADALALPAPLELVGHSLGGRVALQVRLLAPERVGRIAILDIPPGPIEAGDTERVVHILARAPDRAESREAMAKALEAEGLSRPLVEWLLMNGDPDSSGFSWRVDRAALVGFHDAMRKLDLWSAVEGGAPTLCVRGAESPYVGPEDEARLEAAGVPVRALAGAGHFLHVDRTDELVETLHGWW